MRAGGIEGVHRRRRGKCGCGAVSTATALGLVKRNFTAAAPDQLWVADISYLLTWEGFVHWAVVVNAFSRKVVGWAMAAHLRTELVLDAVGMAISARSPAAGTVRHTDRGTPSTPPTSSARRGAPRACSPRWGGSARHLTTR
jgi:transposase InsO family protein